MKEIDGDLIKMFNDGEFDVIIHGCNCFHTMGAGIAKQIEDKHPEAGFYDLVYSEEGDLDKLSNHTIALTMRDNKEIGTIVNLYTQFNPGADFKLIALDLGFYKLSHRLENTIKIGIPKIGAGIGGGDWDKIEPIIAKHMEFHNITVVNYKKDEDGKSEG